MSEERSSIHGEWSTSLAFILAAAGSTVGLGNIWKFPYIVGTYGGGAFIMVYLLCIAIIGIPIMMSEAMLGRRGRQSPYNSMKIIAMEEGRSGWWAWLGGIGALSGFLILSYYSVVGGQVAAYVFRALSGEFNSQSAEGIRSIYEDFRANPEVLLAWHTIFMVITLIVVSRGVRAGLERAIRILMPVLIVLLVLLMGYGMNSDGFQNSMSFLFHIDFSSLVFEKDKLGNFVFDTSGSRIFTMKGILTAMGHAFFTLSLGLGAIMIYGSYLKREVSIAGTVFLIVILDTVIAILAGLVVFPIVFEYGLNPSAGPSLIFESLPIAFGAMPFGELIGFSFFLLLLFAAWTSAISLVEPVVTWMIERHNMTRVQASVWTGIAIWMIGIFSVFSASGTTLRRLVNTTSDYFKLAVPDMNGRFFNLTAFDLVDALVTLFLLPMGGLFIVVFAGWRMRSASTRDELNLRKDWMYNTWRFMVRYVTPIALLVVFIFGLVAWIGKHFVTRAVIT